MLQDLIMIWQTKKYCFKDFARSYYDLANNKNTNYFLEMLQDLIMIWQTKKYLFKDVAISYYDLAKKTKKCDFARSYYALTNKNICFQRFCKILL